MKHDFKITLMLIAFFLAAQYVGLFIVDQYISIETTVDEITGEKTHNMTHAEALPLGFERPEVSEDFSWLYIMIAILIGTVIILVLARFKQKRVWKIWYFISLIFIMTIALNPFFGPAISFFLSFILSGIKTYRPNFYVHNITEIFLYGGLAAMLVPIMNIFAGLILLIVIAIYDAIAVWKSKHMVTLAEFQSDSNVFAGLFIPYKTQGKKIKLATKSVSQSGKHKVTNSLSKSSKLKTKDLDDKNHLKKSHSTMERAILGGGDIAFPLVFAGTVMKTSGFFGAALIPPFAALGLFILLYKSKKGKFYPAMPFISAGCILGYIVLALVNYIF